MGLVLGTFDVNGQLRGITVGGASFPDEIGDKIPAMSEDDNR